jgi:4a-hydroxytetrahydrobiopterin dehydratase
MIPLHQQRCKICRRGDPSLSDTDIIRLHREIPNWEVKRKDGHRCLERVFIFRNFAYAMGFVVQAGKLAHEENHHPLIIIEYDAVTITWWTHKVEGLHINDFIMAAKIDLLSQSYAAR